ncbi:MAG: MoxR family ATPase [Gemmatimonadetes bacterium]|nr:MoxR family ATPase [Gemmatimonadota bacterium]
MSTTERQLESMVSAAARLRAEIGRRIVGQGDAVEEVVLCLFAGGHVLLEGVPGLAKTLLVRTLAEALALEFRRIQFTPDLMPGDITGTEVIEEDHTTGRRATRFLHGPVFTNVLLADEINRTPPKTQAALLEAMQEGRVTAGGVDMALPRPFFVLATQNPIEQEGTYPLPEAQLDRFMLNVRMTYPDLSDEVRVLMTTTGVEAADISAVLDADEVIALQRTVREVEVAADVFQYVAELVRATRPTEASSPEEIRRWVRWGAGPRAGQSLILAAKARALLEGRVHVSPADVRRLAAPVLRHRVLLNFHAEADGTTTDDVVDLLLDRIRAPRAGP